MEDLFTVTNNMAVTLKNLEIIDFIIVLFILIINNFKFFIRLLIIII